jgi:hypothetical protein
LVRPIYCQCQTQHVTGPKTRKSVQPTPTLCERQRHSSLLALTLLKGLRDSQAALNFWTFALLRNSNVFDLGHVAATNGLRASSLDSPNSCKTKL